MKNYGIELEFFVTDKEGNIVPAFKATTNLDGNPVIGELRTKVHNNIIDCVFELKKLIFIEKEKIEKAGFKFSLIPIAKVNDEFIKQLRREPKYINRKSLELLEEYSIYGKKLSKVLPKGTYKASLQINISENNAFRFSEAVKVGKVYESRQKEKSFAEVFNYVDLIATLDKNFKEEIATTGRVAGVYCIKDGELGNRIEYRSLPNTVDIDKLIQVLK